jgi:hypothetical protein
MKKVIVHLALTPTGLRNRIQSIKNLREATSLGLREAKDCVEALANTAYLRRNVVMFAQDVTLLEVADRAPVGRCFDILDVQHYKDDTLDLTVRPMVPA